MKLLFILSLSILTLNLYSCKNYQLEKDVIELSKLRISIPYDSLIEVKRNSEVKDTPYKLIIYSDSTECSICALGNMFYWEMLQDTIKKQNLEDMIRFEFVFAPSKEIVNQFLYKCKQAHIPFSVFVDTNTFIKKANPLLPNNRLLHTFLLNQQDSVVLIGNPKSNTKIEQLLIKHIK